MAGCHFKIIQKDIKVPDFPLGRGTALGCVIFARSPVASMNGIRITECFSITMSYATVCTLRTVQG
jgi:hypothetical protein